MDVTVNLDCTLDQRLEIETREGELIVTADPSLSEDQVRAACDTLVENGPAVYAAWRARMGITAAEVAN